MSNLSSCQLLHMHQTYWSPLAIGSSLSFSHVDTRPNWKQLRIALCQDALVIWSKAIAHTNAASQCPWSLIAKGITNWETHDNNLCTSSLGIRVLWNPEIPGHIHTFVHNDTGPAIGPFDIFDVTLDPWKMPRENVENFTKNPQWIIC